MPYQHELQSDRFELKYVVSERRAQDIRDFLRGHVEPDAHARPDQGNAYPVYSLYLDSPTLTLFHQTRRGLKNRFKLRIRFYDDVADHPAFLEIKRRISDVIRKERAAVSREGVRRLLDGFWPDEMHLMGSEGNGRNGSALQNFCRLYDAIRAEPWGYVSYVREAYVSPESNRLRITFDRQLLGTPYVRGAGISVPADGVRPSVGGVILEIKFTDRFPHWVRELVRTFGLQRRSVPKYIECVETVGHSPLAEFGKNRSVVR